MGVEGVGPTLGWGPNLAEWRNKINTIFKRCRPNPGL
jgi:hypothetical protein